MKKEDILIEICNDALLRRDEVILPSLSQREWNELLPFASKHGLLSVFAQDLANVVLPDQKSRMMLVQWYLVAEKGTLRYQERLKVMSYLAKMFAEENIDILFLKGASLAQLYPKPEWRAFSDIDYYLYGKSEQGIEIMRQRGIENEGYYHHHTQASLNGILLENHYDFLERINHQCDIILDDALKMFAEKEGRTIKASFLGEDIHNAYLMTPTMNAIFLMRHMSAHFASESIPLRMLYDWALFLKHHVKDVDWKMVSDLYEKSGLVEFVSIIQQLLKSKLGVEFTECPVPPGNEEKASKLWHSIIYPPKQNPYQKFTFKYYIFETKTFWKNRWKHKIVYPDESYLILFFKYAWLGTKMMLFR